MENKSKHIGKFLLLIVIVVFLGWKFLLPRLIKDQASTKSMILPDISVEVEVGKLIQSRSWNNFSGRVEAVDYVEVRPQVSGTITEIKINDGQIVKQGDLLYVIDPLLYEIAVQQAKAEVSIARNANIFAKLALDRADSLIKQSAISQRAYDERHSNYLRTKAEIEKVESHLKYAQINLENAYIKAPISGRISRAEITIGNLVNAGSTAPLLTTIVSDDGFYVEFEIDEKTYINSISHIRSNKNIKIPVEIYVGNNRKHYDGYIHSFDNRISPSSGTIRARAFINDNDINLIPGLFVSINMGSAEKIGKILLSEKAIGTYHNRKFVYIVNEKNIIEYREVNLGEVINGNRVILTGIQEGEMVVTSELMRMRPGMRVSPKIKTIAEKSVIQNSGSAVL